jgi:hypothetical protein
MSSVPSSNLESTSSHEEQVKKAAEIREWIEGKISELETEIEKLREILTIVDANLRRTSFVSAAELKPIVTLPPSGNSGTTGRELQPSSAGTRRTALRSDAQIETRELKRARDGFLLATARIDAQRIVVLPAAGVRLSKTTPPFQTFFLSRILDGYKSKDIELSKKDTIAENAALKYDVEEKDGAIMKITIENYRETVRLNEILNTLIWAFSRMLEKK